jgi:hypothetical protein
VPAAYEELERFNSDYERTHFAHTDAGHRLAIAARDLHRGGAIVHALLDEPLLDALGLRRPVPGTRRVAEAALRTRARVVRRLPERRRPRLRTLERHRSYPDGYELERLGPATGGKSWQAG